jgi:geranylgeranyl reductase family protein
MAEKFASNFYDVAVVGSGPAGSSAAFSLARQGIKVLIIEKAALPRYKTCGGGLVWRAVELLPIDIGKAIERRCYCAQLNLLDAGLHFSTHRSQPIITMAMRDKLDYLLVCAAQAEGALLLVETELKDLNKQADRVELITNRGKFQAKFLIAADGAVSLTARKAGWRDSRHLIPALECELSVNAEMLNRFGAAARFDFGVAPFGYGWVFPKSSHLSVGVLSMQRQAINLNKILQDYLNVVGIDRFDKIERHGALIPVRPRSGALAHERVMLVGDVAGFADPITAEGISFAIQSGQLAANAIIDGDFQEQRVNRSYHSLLSEKILPELRWGRRLARLIYFYPRLRSKLFHRYGQQFSEAVTDLVMGKRTYRNILSDPKNYLRLFMKIGSSHL